MKVNNKFPQIVAKARIDKVLKFTSLAHHINKDLLCSLLKRNKFCGIGNVTLENYASNLHSNIEELVLTMKNRSYCSKPVKRVYIPKPGKEQKRGLGIYSTEDKLVQLELKHIFEQDFLNFSNGFRLNKSSHTAIIALNQAVMTKPVNFVVEVDIKKFFDNVSHYWLLRCLEERIIDPNFLWIMERFLKSGVVENGVFIESDKGTPQGGNLSPLLSKIYLNYVLYLWFENKFKSTSRNYMQLVLFCDNFFVILDSRKDAKLFLTNLREKFAKYGLEVAEDKTQPI